MSWILVCHPSPAQLEKLLCGLELLGQLRSALRQYAKLVVSVPAVRPELRSGGAGQRLNNRAHDTAPAGGFCCL
jgi:hypothetical protein